MATLPDDLYPLLPAYLQVTAARLIQSEPPRFGLRLAAFPSTPYETSAEVSAATLFLLSLADGRRTFRECRERVREEFAGLDDACEDELCALVERGILVDASTHPELMPGTRDRYARHLLFYGSVGAHAPSVQRRLQSARVAIVGVGGIGTWLSFLLGAAGVGHIKLIDGDLIEESNLTRQLYFTPRDIGKPKVDVARQSLLNINPGITCESLPRSILHESDMDELVGDVDLILLSGDTPANIHDIVDSYSYRRHIPWSAAGYAHSVAVCGPLIAPGRTACRGCMIPEDEALPMRDLPLISEINRRFQVSSFGPVNGLAASMQAKEALAWLGGLEHLVQTLDAVVAMDALTMCSTVTRIPHAPTCNRCSRASGPASPRFEEAAP
ncbi:HesA/MoeB/ThiF family protein [Sorangium sp. KYC3313]|uniref:HesA/MoeB/ThiF family protein n=1 Tax=Sorangium sp. KYC3313 TaxID=3449740 RepID=UPI003F8B06F2